VDLVVAAAKVAAVRVRVAQPVAAAVAARAVLQVLAAVSAVVVVLAAAASADAKFSDTSAKTIRACSVAAGLFRMRLPWGRLLPGCAGRLACLMFLH
jgi:hypothetical protein